MQRRSFTLWFTDEAVEQGTSKAEAGRRGRECTYSCAAIQCLLVIKQVFHLPLRAMRGLAGSLVRRMGLDLVVPLRRVCRRLELAISAGPMAPMTATPTTQATRREGSTAIAPREDAVPWPVADETPYAAQRNAVLETIESPGTTAASSGASSAVNAV